MLKTNIVLVVCLIGICAAATAKPKAAEKVKDVKEKRDAAVSSGAYTYEAPQKSLQIPIHSQQQQQQQYHHYQQPQQQQHQPQQQTKTIVEYQQVPQKVAPLDTYRPKQQAAAVQIETQYYEPAQKYAAASVAGYPSSAENYVPPFKGYADFDFSYPEFEAFNQMQIVHYNQELNKINSAVVGIPAIKSHGYSPSFSGYKAAAYQPSYSFASPSPAYSFPSHAYAIPQQQHETYFTYAPSAASAPSGPAEHAYYGFSQSPSAFYVPQTVSIGAKPAKTPDYAAGLKGLGHYSSGSSVASPSHLQSSYVKQQYEAPVHVQYTQTERPFKASAYLGSSPATQESYSVQSISSKPAEQYLPSKTYLPAKEQTHYVPEQSPVEYQIQYIQAPSKSYIPASHYLPAKSQVQEQYLPAKVQVQEHYLPVKAQEHYSPAKVQAQEQPKSSYLPPPKSTYLPAKQTYSPPKNSYLPASQPTASYLPPNNPYHENSLSSPTHYLSALSASASSHSAPSQYAQYYQQQDSAESLEYQQPSASAGHK